MNPKIILAGGIAFTVTGIIWLVLSLYSYDNPPQEPPRDAANAVIKMQRTTCYGTCPAYSLTIFGNGTVIYDGHDFVNVKGMQRSEIPADKVEELVDEFYRIDFFSLQDRYTLDITDLPTTTTSITINNSTKTVENYAGAPEKLEKLEDKIDEVTGARRWIEG